MDNVTSGVNSYFCCGSWRSPKTILVLVGLILLTGLLTVALLRDRWVNQPQWQVNVIGQGKVKYQPDIAKVTLGVQVDKATTAEQALQQLNDKMAGVVKAVTAVGVAVEDIQTQTYYLNPQYDYKNGITTPAGYSANQQLVVKVKIADANDQQVSKVIAGATKAGANQVGGINFDVSNLQDLKEQARLAAIADAKDKSVKLAAAAGVRLGKVVGWWENVVQAPGQPSPYYGDGKGGLGGAAAATPSVPNGDQEVIIEITLNYQVK